MPRAKRLKGLVVRASWICGVIGPLLGCEAERPTIEIPPLTPPFDAAAHEPPPPPGAQPCERDAECDDGVDCTIDHCVEGGYCVNVNDNGRCTDGIFCNGEEVCDFQLGCVSSGPRSCNDDNVCTMDVCNENQKRCDHLPRDVDGDGEVDWHCFDGTDCDDFDATRGGTAVEICGDGVDNDCDGTTDETRDCTRAAYDTCGDALDVSAGGSFVVALAGTASDYTLTCSALGARDVAFRFTTRREQDVTLTVRGLLGDDSSEIAFVGVRAACDDVVTERECARGFPAQVRMRALPAGTYFAIANSPMAQRLVLDARFDDPTPAPTNTSCESALDLGEGGRVRSDLVDVSDSERVPCAPNRSGDLVYSFTTEREHDVELSVLSDSGDPMYVAVRSVCDDPASALRCLASQPSVMRVFGPARGRMHRLPAGTYYAIVEGPSSREVDFSLDLALHDPTDPPLGDSCQLAEELPVNTTVSGSLASRQDLVDVRCGCTPEEGEDAATCGLYFPDHVYRVRVPEPSDLRVEIAAANTVVGYDFRAVCELGETQRSCRRTGAVNDRIRNLEAGDYYLIVESPDSTDFLLSTQLLPRTEPVAVEGNHLCANAFEIPETGGLFTGSTFDALSTYEATCGGNAQSADAAYRLRLSTAARVSVTLQAGFDTVLYRFRDDGSGAESCRSRTEAVCNDDSAQSTNSRLEESLLPGTYYYIVDGFSTHNRGPYTLEVEITP